MSLFVTLNIFHTFSGALSMYLYAEIVGLFEFAYIHRHRREAETEIPLIYREVVRQ